MARVVLIPSPRWRILNSQQQQHRSLLLLSHSQDISQTLNMSVEQVATNITYHAGASTSRLSWCHRTEAEFTFAIIVGGSVYFVSRWISWCRTGSVDVAERAKLLSQKGVTIWFTGLSASGKVCLLFGGTHGH